MPKCIGLEGQPTCKADRQQKRLETELQRTKRLLKTYRPGSERHRHLERTGVAGTQALRNGQEQLLAEQEQLKKRQTCAHAQHHRSRIPNEVPTVVDQISNISKPMN